MKQNTIISSSTDVLPVLTSRFLREGNENEICLGEGRGGEWDHSTITPLARTITTLQHNPNGGNDYLWESPLPAHHYSWIPGCSEIVNFNTPHRNNNNIFMTADRLQAISYSSSPTTVETGTTQHHYHVGAGMDTMWSPTVTPALDKMMSRGWTTPSPQYDLTISTIQHGPITTGTSQRTALPPVPNLITDGSLSSQPPPPPPLHTMVVSDTAAAAAAPSKGMAESIPVGPPAFVLIPMKDGILSSFSDDGVVNVMDLGGVGGLLPRDIDEVSFLADNPDDDDVDVLPHATYDVLANIFDQMNMDDGDDKVRQEHDDDKDGDDDEDSGCYWQQEECANQEGKGLSKDSSSLQSPPRPILNGVEYTHDSRHHE